MKRLKACIFFKGMPFGRAPVLEVDGTKIAGSVNILRFLGRKFGKTPRGSHVTACVTVGCVTFQK